MDLGIFNPGVTFTIEEKAPTEEALAVAEELEQTSILVDVNAPPKTVFSFGSPTIAAAIQRALDAGFSEDDAVEIGLAQEQFEKDIAELEEETMPELDRVFDQVDEVLDKGNFLDVLDEFIILARIPADEGLQEPSPVVGEEIPELAEPEEEKDLVSIFGDIFGVLGDVFESGGAGDIPFAPDLFDVVQFGTGIANLFDDDDATSTVPTVQGNGVMNGVVCGPGQRALTPLQVVQACAKAKTGKSISKKGLKSMVRVCGLQQTAATIGCSITAVCLVASSPTRRRSGISASDMRRTRSTINKVTKMYKSLPTRSAARRK